MEIFKQILLTVVLDNALEKRDGAFHGLLGHEPHYANHRKATIVDLLYQPRFFLLHRFVLAELEGIEEVEGNGVRDAIRSILCLLYISVCL